MAYLVRRLLENTSNEGFLANKFAKGASRGELLKNPSSVATMPSFQSTINHQPSTTFHNKPVATAEWLPSLNPANQKEVIGYAAQARVEHAEAALEAGRRAQPAWGRT